MRNLISQILAKADGSCPTFFAVRQERQDLHCAEFNEWALQQMAAHILDPLPYLCDGQFCQGADANKPRYYDDNHLTETGNRRLVPLFAGVFGNARPGFATAAVK